MFFNLSGQIDGKIRQSQNVRLKAAVVTIAYPSILYLILNTSNMSCGFSQILDCLAQVANIKIFSDVDFCFAKFGFSSARNASGVKLLSSSARRADVNKYFYIIYLDMERLSMSL